MCNHSRDFWKRLIKTGKISSEEVEKTFLDLKLIASTYFNEPVYYLRTAQRGKVEPVKYSKKGAVCIRADLMETMIREAIQSGRSERTINSFLSEEVDHETQPPNCVDYHWWERRRRSHYRRDKVTLEFLTLKKGPTPKLHIEHIGEYSTDWRF